MKVQSTPVVVEHDIYCWLFQRNLRRIGVHRTDGWCTQIRDEKPIYFDREEKCVLLLILLELTMSEFNQCLANAKHEAPDYADSIQRFPLTMLLQHTLCSEMSDYWPARALDWIDACSDILPELKDALAYATGNKALSQSLRHRARRMWRISQRTQPMHRDDVLAVSEI